MQPIKGSSAASVRSRLGQIPAQLPPLTPAGEVLAEVLSGFGATEKISVSKAAERYRHVSEINYRGPWDNTVAPYMIEPMNMAMSRRYGAGVFIGPSRTLKTSSFIENLVAYLIMVSPRDCRIIAPDGNKAKSFSQNQISKMLRVSPQLKERQLTMRGADTIYRKLFAGGMTLDFGWPVISHLSQDTLVTVLFTDYDRIKNMDLDGEGDPFLTGAKRTLTVGSLGWTALECSPGFEQTDMDWYAKSPHEAPPTRGGLAHYNTTTRGRFYWNCPHCSERFEPDFHLITYDQDKEKPPLVRGRTAAMVCPHNGCLITDADKRECNRTGLWLHEARDGDNGGLCTIDEEDRIRETDKIGWWLKGPPAAFQSMISMVTEYLNAEQTFERTMDETALKAVTSTSLALPYKSRVNSNESELNAGALWNRAHARDLKVAPAGTAFITTHVDVQATRFVVQTVAWMRDLEWAVIDRFDISTPDPTSPGAALNEIGQPGRQLSPARYVEDWALLEPLEATVYRVEGADYGLKPMGVTCDSVGEPGVTDKAKKFWRRMRKEGKQMRFHLLQGVTQDYGNRTNRRRPEEKTKDRKGRITRRKSDVPIIFMVSNRLKDEVAASLLREENGPGRLHLTQALGRDFFDEICAEERVDAKWALKSGVKRNESFDLAYHAKGFVVQMLLEEMDWDSPEDWAIVGPNNALAVPLNQAQQMNPVEGMTAGGVLAVSPPPLSAMPQGDSEDDAPVLTPVQRRAQRMARWAKSRVSL